MKLQILTNSEMSAFRNCRALHGFAYIERLRPRHDPLYFRAGHLLHRGCDAGWRAAWDRAEDDLDGRYHRAVHAGTEAILKMAEEQIEEIECDDLLDVHQKEQLLADTEDAVATSQFNVRHYFTVAKADLAYVPLAIEAAAQTRVPTANGQRGRLLHKGRWDLLLWDRDTNRLITCDHKGTKDDVDGFEKRLELDTQLTGYVVQLRENMRVGPFSKGQFPDTTVAAASLARDNVAQLARARTGNILINVNKRRVPSVPKLNLIKKNQVVTAAHRALLEAQTEDGEPRGEVSVALIDTLPEIYAQALQDQLFERELPVTDKQRERASYLKSRGDTFFRQHEFYRNDAEIERWRQEVWVEALQIKKSHEDPKLRTRNPGACTMPWSPPCAYAAVCRDPDSPEARAGFDVIDNPHHEATDP